MMVMLAPALAWLIGAALGWLNSNGAPTPVGYSNATAFGMVVMVAWSMSRMPSFPRQEKGFQFFAEFLVFVAFVLAPVAAALRILTTHLSEWNLVAPQSGMALVTPAIYLVLWILFRPGGGFPLLLLLATPLAAVALGVMSWVVHPSQVSLGLTVFTWTVAGLALGLAGAAAQRLRDRKRRRRS
jgi:hypothetical protein